MPMKRMSAEQIVVLLRQIKVQTGQGHAGFHRHDAGSLLRQYPLQLCA